ncbi:MAG: SusE domain-containing protein [Chitinophagaceae bacterium]|nr:SusE domain-containing protein [Chitinophagaceae bacterium]
MKNMIKLLSGTVLSAVLLLSCKKDENRVYFEGGTNPVLSVSSESNLFLDSTKKITIALTFNWTNPNYRFNTGVSSQTVSYILQVDTTGSNFTNPNIQETSIAAALSASFTVKEINTFLNKLLMQRDVPHNMEFRIKSTINGTVPLYSNVIKIVITPYLDVAVPLPPTGELYITGDGTPSGWTNSPPATQKCTKLSLTEYTITMNFVPGLYYKFLSTLSQWQPQYGGNSATGGDFSANMGGGSDLDAIPTPSVAGTYKVTLNFVTGKYAVVKL